MKKLLAIVIEMVVVAPLMWSQAGQKQPSSPGPASVPEVKLNQPSGLYAVLDTTKGRIVWRHR